MLAMWNFHKNMNRDLISASLTPGFSPVARIAQAKAVSTAWPMPQRFADENG
jgi:hypothetical protein